MMKTDVKETDEGYEVDVELLGFKKDEIQLELNNGYLTITAEKGLDKENKKGRMLRQELRGRDAAQLLRGRTCDGGKRQGLLRERRSAPAGAETGSAEAAEKKTIQIEG